MGLVIGTLIIEDPAFRAAVPLEKPDLMVPVFIRDYLELRSCPPGGGILTGPLHFPGWNEFTLESFSGKFDDILGAYDRLAFLIAYVHCSILCSISQI